MSEHELEKQADFEENQETKKTTRAKASKKVDKNATQLTKEGKERLEKERRDLINIRRPEIIEAIKEARGQGDLSENADYDAARTEQAQVEARISELDRILSNVIIIGEINQVEGINVGSIVKIQYLDANNLEIQVKIVGTLEANPASKNPTFISYESALGKALMTTKVKETISGEEVERGIKSGDVITFKSDTGRQHQIKIIEVNAN